MNKPIRTLRHTIETMFILAMLILIAAQSSSGHNARLKYTDSIAGHIGGTEPTQNNQTVSSRSIWATRLLRLLPITTASAAPPEPEEGLTIIRRFHVLDAGEKHAIVVQTDPSAPSATRAIPVLNENNVASLLTLSYVNVCRYPCGIDTNVPDSRALSSTVNSAYLAQTQNCESAAAFTSAIDTIKTLCAANSGSGSTGSSGPCTGWTCNQWTPDTSNTCSTSSVTQARDCSIKSPPGCYGTPADPPPTVPTSRTVSGTKDCGPANPCTGWTTGAWQGQSAAQTCVGETVTQTRTVEKAPPGCTGTPANEPDSSRVLSGTQTGGSCSNSNPCTNWSCSSWTPSTGNTCTSSSVDQTRDCSTKTPPGCTGTPILTKPAESQTVPGTQQCQNCSAGNWSSWSPSTSSVCDGVTFTQTRSRTDSCGVTTYGSRPATGTKTTGDCPSEEICTWGGWSTWSPSTGSQTCGTSFTQTRSRSDNCGNTDGQSRTATGSGEGSWSAGSWGACSANCIEACPGQTVSGTKTRSVTCNSACGCGGTEPAGSGSCTVSGCQSQGTYSYGACDADAAAVCVGDTAYGTEPGVCSNSCGCTGQPSKPCSKPGTKNCIIQCTYTVTPATCGTCNKCPTETCTATGSVINTGVPGCSGGTMPEVPTSTCPGTSPAGSWTCSAYSGSPGSCVAPSTYTKTRTCTCNGGCCGAEPATSQSYTCPSSPPQTCTPSTTCSNYCYTVTTANCSTYTTCSTTACFVP